MNLFSIRNIFCNWLSRSAIPILAAITLTAFLPSSAQAKYRVIFSNDFPPTDVVPGSVGTGPADHISDPDSLQSLVRFLVYSNLFDVEGLVESAGTWANVANKQNILDVLNLYDQAYPNLIKHDAQFPTANQLRSVTYQGRDGSYGISNVSQIVGAGMDSEASNAIISIVDKADTRPVWFVCGGGPRELAQAIWKVQSTRTASQLQAFLAKLRVYLIARQDGSAQWLLDNFPSLFIIESDNNYMGMFWYSYGSDPTLENSTWVTSNLRTGHGALGAVYPPTGGDATKPGVVEGDSPAFLHLVSATMGKNDPEQPTQWGWGGKFVQPDPSKPHWFDDPIGGQAIWQWRTDMQNDFATRCNWMIGGPTGAVATGTYKIVSRNSGLSMEVKSGATANGAQIDQNTYSDAANQHWTITSLGNGVYKIIGVGSGRSVDIAGASTANGAKVQIWDYYANSNQQFTITATTDGWYRITPLNATSSCLDVTGASTSPGANVQLWTWYSANNQQWGFQGQ